MQRVETEHRDKLEQLSKMQIEQESALDFQNDHTPVSKSATANASVSSKVFSFCIFLIELK